MNNIFDEFESTNYSDWIKKIEIDLKGKPFDVLASNPEPDLEIVAYHHSDNAPEENGNTTSRNLSRSNNNWKIRQHFEGKTTQNKNLLAALNDGVNAIGISIDTTTDYTSLTKGILFDHIHSDIAFSELETAIAFKSEPQSILNFDVIGLNALEGKSTISLENHYEFFQRHPENKSIWVSGTMYGSAGASTVQELACTIAHLNEYIQFLSDQGVTLKEINEKITLELSVNENYFVNIAKFRVIRDLVAMVFKGHQANFEASTPSIFAKTNIRHLAKNDKNNNALRETTQAMSAVIGGCDVLTVDYGRFGTETEVRRFERIAKNIQLVLKEEAYLDKVVDPSGGSYYIESITNQLLNKSWQLFLEIENNGGLLESLKDNTIQNRIIENKNKLVADLLSNKRTFLGVNKHPNGMEEWIEPINNSSEALTDFTPLTPFYLENHFSKTVADHE